MSDDVTIDAAFARIWAKNLRERYGVECAPLADLLDPKRSLRDEVAEAIKARVAPENVLDYVGDADAVLVVVADAFVDFADAHCWRDPESGEYAIKTRDVGTWLRGGTDA